MKYRRLGGSGLKVSEISLGSWLTYGGYVERENAVRAIETAYGLGVNFFDTANVYEKGAAEKLLGETLRGFPRESYILATKVYGVMGDGPNDRGLSRKHITEQCHASLKRLGADYVDIMYCHRYDPETPIEETLRTLDDLVRQGKVLYVGVSEWTAAQMTEALAVADRYLLDRIVVNQPIYNMFERYIEKEIIPLGERKGIGQVVFSPLAQGLLTGKYSSAEDIPEGSRASRLEWMRKGVTEEKIAKVQELGKVAAELDLSVGNLALAWILRQSNVASALVGASRPEQVEENVKASGVELSSEVLSRIDEIIA
ncbi:MULTISPECIES: aldo/keto reductase family protein [unclassified Paenibacillus]|uniref:aldo/keto reductase family protein n=1 Tax=unclassified Paenibacillus TaxID=185978 RepID=UPI00240491F6|nr:MULTISPECIES: aldo/keto reductase family protein [unclassified Paenibacillus]MDF9841839.1 voltage-dependent potassium channel beta subunit [Paenibacillus sp. PastF-2]MDF9848480.1 voltage-dependent potassium channel beta subunit [Paenibacillus sp. PastM-2]MDF9854999.1 voltage-dependent potassium channel beta subunit [Paenibacillus sp. PastF-1]MDH6480268.1 voltage-dependent potassium channel beta subunit [Paenibacillus sp. PastH-2]MDH6507748.1 voltage-dependent potassium channel beta subunit 